MHRLTWIALVILLTHCNEKPIETPTNLNSMKRTKQNTGTYTGQVITGKPFGDPDAKPQLYLRLGMGDFRIDFEKSAISSEELEDQLNKHIEVKGETQQQGLDQTIVIKEWVK